MMYRVINWLQTGIEETPIKDTPYAFGFAPSMANPVRGRSPIAYTTSITGKITLKVYDSAGRLVKTLVNSVEPAGAKTLFWDDMIEQATGEKLNVKYYADQFFD